MNLEMGMKLGCLAGMILLGGLSLWFQGNAVLKGRAAALIAEAEGLYQDSTKAGGEKFTWVVMRLHALLPAPVRLVITQEMVAQVVQRTFDAVADYARLQLNKVTERVRE